MDGFILEILAGDTWRRPGDTYWTKEQAEQAAESLIRKSLARRVRILNVRVDLTDPVGELHWQPRPKSSRKHVEAV